MGNCHSNSVSSFCRTIGNCSCCEDNYTLSDKSTSNHTTDDGGRSNSLFPPRRPTVASIFSPRRPTSASIFSHDIALPTLPETLEDTRIDVLHVEKIDLNINENGKLHHTDKYDQMKREKDPLLVLRRGQEFIIDITFNRAFNKERDGVSFLFTISEGKPSMNQNTLVVVPLLLHRTSDYWNETPWTAFLGKVIDSRVQVHLKTSPKCSIGKWNLAVDTKLKERSQEEKAAISHALKDPVYILFNPWSQDDSVFLDDEEGRQEYVLEDSGLIWRGTHNRLRPTPWTYSQFEEDVLDCALYLLAGPGRLSPVNRSDPVKVSRAISAIINSPDDNGLIEGNWGEKFEGGVPPTKWTGSLKIMKKYWSTKKPVQFGQCWVFSGALTTVARTLGIPCRPVTNYASAHDTQCSLTIDYFMDEDGKPVEHLNTDSVWNFHVWNEVWMKRPDLDSSKNPDEVDSEIDKSCSGWQVIDSTPQELSEEMFRCGPAPVAAIRRGEILRPYDGNFVFSEVNADKLYWRYRGVGAPLKLLGKKSEAIGISISTKAKGKFEREDITESYKYPENSEKERESMLTALKQSESLFSRYYLNEDFNDVRFDFFLIDDIVIGSPFRVVLRIENFNQISDYNVSVSLRVDTMLYTGKVKEQVKKELTNVLVPAGLDQEVVLPVSYAEYGSKLCDQCAFNVACLAKVQNTNYEYFAQDDFRVRKPDIKFKIAQVDKGETILTGEPLKGILYFKNPLPTKLNKGQFLLELPGTTIDNPIKIKLKKSVEPHEIVQGSFELVPKDEGEKTLTAKFTSNELEDVDGFLTIKIEQNNEI